MCINKSKRQQAILTLTNQQKIDAHHESGHAIIIKLFEEDFVIKSISLTPNRYSNQVNTTGMNGVNHMKPRRKTLINPTIESKDKLIICLWGGLVAQNIYINGINVVKQNIQNYLAHPNLLIRTGIQGDLNYINRYIGEQCIVRRLARNVLISDTLGFAFDFLLRDKVWETLELLSNQILESANLTLSRCKIEMCYRKTGFSRFLYKNKSNILEKRYSVPLKMKIFYYLKFLIQ